MNRSCLIFCAAAVIASALVSAALYPLAALSPAEAEAAKTPLEADQMGDVDLGDFGTVSVLDLVAYWIDNPPAQKAAPGGGAKKVRFQGC